MDRPICLNGVHNTSPNGKSVLTHEMQNVEVEKDFYPDEMPGKLKDDVITQYYRCRFADRDRFKLDLSDEDRMHVEDEEQRLIRVRAKVSGEIGDLPAMKALDKYRHEWRQHAIESSGEALKRVPQKYKDLKKRLKKQAPTKPLPEEVIAERIKNEMRILKKVQNWKRTSLVTPTHKIPSAQHADADPHLEVRLLTLKECEREHEDQAKSFDLAVVDGRRMVKYPIDKVLGEGGDTILKNKTPGTIRYFHLPANNMDWIERFMANYYDPRDRGNYDDRQSKFYRKGASNVLRREFWQGQQHGSNVDPIHARHMRPRVSVISQDNDAFQSVKNFALFMPFLHWEMSHRRARMTEIIKECANIARKKKLEENRGFQQGRIERRELIDIVNALKIKRAASKYSNSKSTSKPKRSCWGEYMLQIAKVVDMMDCELDEKLLREDLFKDSPLHPRRTLDQSYHWKLENTARRDQDQVVYRGTNGRFKSRQVVMVDQLWMWILDEDTIITAFPRRWGRNKPDSSGVHKGIRDRLDDLQEGDIKSIYDLATLIMDQCSRVFFDRTMPVDERPEVLDIFANAIANVSEHSTNAFEEFWSHMLKLNKKTNNKFDKEASANYFNINAEGLLLREAHDISEELKMMQRVYDQQIHVTKEFRKALLKTSNQVIYKESAVDSEIHINNSSNDVVVDKTVLETKKATGKFTEKWNKVPKESISKVKDLLEELEGRKWELGDLDGAAKDVSDQLNGLLSLKQQQASALEAKAALERAEESVTQGRSIMVFTIVTIVFLPLGFMSSIFGMNNTTFTAHEYDLKTQLRYMFTISLGVVLVSVIAAFSWWLLPSKIRSYSANKSSKGRGLSKQERKLIKERQRDKKAEEANDDQDDDEAESTEYIERFLNILRKRAKKESPV